MTNASLLAAAGEPVNLAALEQRSCAVWQHPPGVETGLMKDAGSRQGINTPCQVPLKLSQPSAVKDNHVLRAQTATDNTKPSPSCFPGARPLDKGSLAEPFPNLQSWRLSLHAGYFTSHQEPAPDLTPQATNTTFISSLSLTPSHPQFSPLALGHHGAMKQPVPMYITGG